MQKQYVRSLFDSIAHRYDLLNHALSGGIDVYWRRKAIAALFPLHPKRILDVATGTADLALTAVRLRPERIIGIDIAEAMLSRGREKIDQRGLSRLIELQTGEAEHLNFTDESFDATMVAFGARNFENLREGISEMWRVLRPGGMILVLEFSRPATFPFKQLYFLYFRFVLPVIGRLISRHPVAYSYLPETVMAFPEGEKFMDILRTLGFSDVHQERLTFGIATLYTGTK